MRDREKTHANCMLMLCLTASAGYRQSSEHACRARHPHAPYRRACRRGLRYDRFDTKAICSATRAALPTGRNNRTDEVKSGYPSARGPAATCTQTMVGAPQSRALVENQEACWSKVPTLRFATHDSYKSCRDFLP